MNIVFSGIQPSGSLHLGNYLGAIKKWVDLNHDEQFFCIVDLHAITAENKNIKDDIYKTIATYLACGIDINKSNIFIQSQIKEHLELYWILNCITPLGWLTRMTQFKDKSKQYSTNAGLLNYPVLMAADILLYKSTIVPVGHDQKQHLELTKQLAKSFNSKFKINVFPIPKVICNDRYDRIMSLNNGNAKMSKSDPNEYSKINLTDSTDMIKNKIMKAKTDSYSDLLTNIDDRPELKNLINIYKQLSQLDDESIKNDIASLNFASFKLKLIDLIIYKLEPISNKIHQLLNDRIYLDSVINKSHNTVQILADKNIKQIKDIIGLM